MIHLSIEDRQHLERMVARSVTEHQLAWAIIEAEAEEGLEVSPVELLSALRRTYDHPYSSYTERWSIAHAEEILALATKLKKIYEDEYK